MTRLFVSIIMAVLGSLFFIGWGLDKLVSHDIPVEDSPEIVVYKKLIEGIQHQLNVLPKDQLHQTTLSLSKQYQLDVTLDEMSNVALPLTLHSQLSESGGLLLATDEETYLLKNIPAHPEKLLRVHIPVTQEENQSLNVFLTAVLYIGVCIILMLWLLPLARRLFILTKAAARIGNGDVNVRVSINKYSYIRTLETSFNQMASQIEKLMADNKLLARSLSHDIRTPMSCLRFGVEAALDCQDIDKKNIYLNRMEAELTNMEEMTTAFLSYAAMERQGIKLELEKVDVNQFLADICQDFSTLAEQYNSKLYYLPLAQNTTFLIDCHWFYRAVQNLIGNAIQYANTEVRVSANIVGSSLEIMIEDDGKGIDEAKLETVFTPFVKLDNERSREQGHFGLGLAICHKVIDWHKGQISAHNSTVLSGACFVISLPLKPH